MTRPKLGRPPASSSAETRERLIDIARLCFAEVGYEATTNRTLAAKAGITTGAIYHYFDSKLDIFVATYAQVIERVYAEFIAAEEAADTFIGKLENVLEAAYRMNVEDPSVAQFMGSSRVDMQRHPELRVARETGGRADFFVRMVERGIATGEIDPGDQDMILALITTITVGLTDAVSMNRTAHRNAIDAIKALLEGKLIRPPV